MSLSCWSHRLDRTRHTSVCGFSYSLSNLFSFKTTLLTSKYIYGCCNDLSLMPHLSFSLMPSFFRDQFVVVAACFSSPFCFFFICHARFGRSSCSHFFPSPHSSPRAPVVVTSSVLRLFFFLLLSGLSFTCYRCILCSITTRAPSRTFSSDHHLLLRPFSSVSFPAFRLLLIAFYVSYLDAPLDLCDFAIGPLTS